MSDEPSLCYVFDAYGTLFDVHSAISSVASRMGPEADRVSLLWRQKQLEYSWIRAMTDRYEDFWQLTVGALEHALHVHGQSSTSLRDDLLRSYLALEPFGEVVSVLGAMRKQGATTTILTNGNYAMIEPLLSNVGLETYFDAVISVEEARTFKPNPAAYSLICSKLSISASNVRFVSSNYWDIVGAKSFGFSTTWVNRTGAPSEAYGIRPDLVVSDLGRLRDSASD